MSEKRALFRSAVFVMLFNEDGKVWLQQRSSTGFLDGHFDFVSGHIDPGEDALEAAVREVYEESCVHVEPNDLKLVHINQTYLDNPYINFTYFANRWKGTAKIGEPHKCGSAGFYSLDALPRYVTLNVRLMHKYFNEKIVTQSKITLQNYSEVMGESFNV